MYDDEVENEMVHVNINDIVSLDPLRWAEVTPAVLTRGGFAANSEQWRTRLHNRQL